MSEAVWRVEAVDGVRWAVGPSDAGPAWFLERGTGIDAVLRGDMAFDHWMARVTHEPVPSSARVLSPIESQEVWAAGVTFTRSLNARRQESSEPDQYDRVYEADRPEIFFKSTAARVRGPDEAVAMRSDSNWNVPEPELAVVANASGALVAVTLGNDMSSREIEGENPLYLPQAKIYDGSCALGPCLLPIESVRLQDEQIAISIQRDGAVVYGGAIAMSELRRTPEELLDWLFRSLTFPVGVVLLTGTGLIPDEDFTLNAGDVVEITLTNRLTLSNPVGVVGRI